MKYLSLFIASALVCCAFGCKPSDAATESADGVSEATEGPDAVLKTETSVFTPGTTAGQRGVLTIEGASFAFRWCPAGKFVEGSPEDEENRDSYETQHEVTLTKGFWILETETTQKLWGLVMGTNPSKWQGADNPVDTVGLDEIDEFCSKIKRPDGVEIRLTTEAEWEYAARAGTTDAHGGKALDEVAWYGDKNYGGTHVVATKQPNAWGIYDMVGNLWEWCSDRYAAFGSDPVTDPKGATPEECPGNVRVDRGGCWDSDPEVCRVANRGYYDFDRKGPYVGFRFVVIP